MLFGLLPHSLTEFHILLHIIFLAQSDRTAKECLWRARAFKFEKVR